MTQRLYDSDGDDCARSLAQYHADKFGPSITLAGCQAHAIADALAEADRALREAETSKIPTIRRRAREARAQVVSAWANITMSMAEARAKSNPARVAAEGGGAARTEGRPAQAPPHSGKMEELA